MGVQKTIKLKCPNLACRKVLSVPQTARGQVVRCKHCMTHLRVPAARDGGQDLGKKAAAPARK